MRSVTLLARAMCDAWPSSPKPVTSVAQRTPTASAARLAAPFSVLHHVEHCRAPADGDRIAAL